MARKRESFIEIFRYLICLVVSGSLAVSTCIAAESDGSGIAIKQIRPMQEVSGTPLVKVGVEDYYDLIGILNQIENNHIVIGDRELTMAAGKRVSRVKQWDLVGVKLNRNGEVSVVERISNDPN